MNLHPANVWKTHPGACMKGHRERRVTFEWERDHVPSWNLLRAHRILIQARERAERLAERWKAHWSAQLGRCESAVKHRFPVANMVEPLTLDDMDDPRYRDELGGVDRSSAARRIWQMMVIP